VGTPPTAAVGLAYQKVQLAEKRTRAIGALGGGLTIGAGLGVLATVGAGFALTVAGHAESDQRL
jgi:hypothetical protein